MRRTNGWAVWFIGVGIKYKDYGPLIAGQCTSTVWEGGGVAEKKRFQQLHLQKFVDGGLSYFFYSILDFLYALKKIFSVRLDTFLYCRIVVCKMKCRICTMYLFSVFFLMICVTLFLRSFFV